LVVFLREPRLIQVAKRFLQRIHMLADFLHRPAPDESNPPNVQARVFLASFMIAYKQSYVFEDIRELETTLLGSATVFVELMERIARLIIEQGSFSNIPKDVTANFSACLFRFLRDFNAWKVPDEAKLTRRIWHALIALEEAQMHLPEDEAADSRLSVELRTQIARLRDKLRQIAGAAKVQEYDASRSARRADGRQLRTLTWRGEGLPERVSNEQLAHELMLDTSFQLTDTAETSSNVCELSRTIRERFHQVRGSFSFF
jgi:hypothetical protein